MLELQGVCKSYSDLRALDGCSFQVRRGRLTGFVGPNGAGKTTAMRAVVGLVRPDAGTLTWDGDDVTSAARRRFGYMPEERGLYPHMRVVDQLVHLGRLSGLPASEAAHEAQRWLAALGLGDRATARLDDLSHGNQQRVQLAAALVHSPELLVLDEPFSGLDPLAMDSMSRLLARLAGAGAAVLFSSHQLDVVEHLCEDVVVISAGRIVLTGELDAIRSRSPYRYLDVTFADDRAGLRLVDLGAAVVAHDGGHVRLRLPSSTDPLDLIAAAGGDLVRLAYEPPALSELFRDAVATDRSAPEAADVAS